MRPEKLRAGVNLAFREWLDEKGNSRFVKLLPEMKRRWIKMAEDEEGFRAGKEVYGYECKEDIYYNMLYISDRWSCACRLSWVIDGIENGSI